MFWYASALNTAAAATATASPSRMRVAGITIQDTTFEIVDPADYGAVLGAVLDRCVVPAEERASDHVGTEYVIPAALVKIGVSFLYSDIGLADTSILDPLAVDYPALARSLRVLKIADNDCDESAELGAFAALATHLRDLTLWSCGLTSLEGLEGCCEYLRTVDVAACYHLTSLDGLGNRVFLEEVILTRTGITSIEPLRSCPALTKVVLWGCRQLSSIEALAGHQRLQEVDASCTGITSIEPLRTCPVVTKVNFGGCQQLSSIEALEGHQWLREIDVSYSGVTSIEPLRSCPRLTAVVLQTTVGQQCPADKVGLPPSVVVRHS